MILNRPYVYFFLLLFFQSSLFAYEQDTHREISITTVDQSILAAQTNNILIDFGLSSDISRNSQQEFPNSKGQKKSIIRLIEEGADFEDTFPRFLHHFYDPINGQSLQKPFISFFTYPSPDWALEDNGDINAQNDSYKTAMDAFYKAMTLPTKIERDAEWGRVFETLGRVIHHIQDMAQPEHVRNDNTLEALINSSFRAELCAMDWKSESFRGDPESSVFNSGRYWIPAFTGMTTNEFIRDVTTS